MFPLTTGLYNGIHFLVIGGVFTDSIRECLTMVCHQMLVLSENYAPQHSQMHQSQSRMVVADRARRVLELSTSDVLDH
jgi:hypothetical protein